MDVPRTAPMTRADPPSTTHRRLEPGRRVVVEGRANSCGRIRSATRHHRDWVKRLKITGTLILTTVPSARAPHKTRTTCGSTPRRIIDPRNSGESAATRRPPTAHREDGLSLLASFTQSTRQDLRFDVGCPREQNATDPVGSPVDSRSARNPSAAASSRLRVAFVPVRAPVSLTMHPTFAMKIVHDGHHRRVRPVHGRHRGRR